MLHVSGNLAMKSNLLKRGSSLMHTLIIIAPDLFILFFYLNPLSPNSDQHPISPFNINDYATPEATRIKDMIIQDKYSDQHQISPCNINAHSTPEDTRI